MILSEYIHPIPPKKFRDEIFAKDSLVESLREVAIDILSYTLWQKFDTHLNDWRNSNHIQLADVNEKGEVKLGSGEKWDKGRDNLTKGDVYNSRRQAIL